MALQRPCKDARFCELFRLSNFLQSEDTVTCKWRTPRCFRLPNLSSLTAFKARVYSAALSKGCSAGSKFLWTFLRSCERSLVHSVSLLLMALTLIQL